MAEGLAWVMREWSGCVIVCVCFGCVCGRQSPRLCGWLCEVSFRATSPAAAARDGVAEIGRALPQPALVRVAVRGQPSGHLVSGGAVRGSDEETGVMKWGRQRKKGA